MICLHCPTPFRACVLKILNSEEERQFETREHSSKESYKGKFWEPFLESPCIPFPPSPKRRVPSRLKKKKVKKDNKSRTPTHTHTNDIGESIATERQPRSHEAEDQGT